MLTPYKAPSSEEKLLRSLRVIEEVEGCVCGRIRSCGNDRLVFSIERGTSFFIPKEGCDGSSAEIDFKEKKITWHTWYESPHNGDFYGEKSGEVPWSEEIIGKLVEVFREDTINALEKKQEKLEREERRRSLYSRYIEG